MVSDVVPNELLERERLASGQPLEVRLDAVGPPRAAVVEPAQNAFCDDLGEAGAEQP
jgi:hypothetical protein